MKNEICITDIRFGDKVWYKERHQLGHIHGPYSVDRVDLVHNSIVNRLCDTCESVIPLIAIVKVMRKKKTIWRKDYKCSQTE